MDYNHLIWEMTQTLQKAEQATSRSEAVNLINRATKLQEAADLLQRDQGVLGKGYTYGPTTDHLHQKVGGAFGSDDYVERWH